MKTREDIIAAWARHGTGTPLPDETVDFIVGIMNEPQVQWPFVGSISVDAPATRGLATLTFGPLP